MNGHDEKRQSDAAYGDDTLQRFPVRRRELDRFKFGKRQYYRLTATCDRRMPLCLDVACGGKPFPKAAVLCDLHVEGVPDRCMDSLVTWGKPFVCCDCRFLPFADKAFDFVTSYYLVEHTDEPGRLLKELRRVSKHGFVQCPSWLNEAFYGEEVHKWIVFKKDSGLFVATVRRSRLHALIGFVFHQLYRSSIWQITHAILDEMFHLFTVQYVF